MNEEQINQTEINVLERVLIFYVNTIIDLDEVTSTPVKQIVFERAENWFSLSKTEEERQFLISRVKEVYNESIKKRQDNLKD